MASLRKNSFYKIVHKPQNLLSEPMRLFTSDYAVRILSKTHSRIKSA